MTEAKPDLKTTVGKLADLRSRLSETLAPAGEASVELIHSAGKQTARERVLGLLDEGTFIETDALARHRVTEHNLDRNRPVTDGVVTGYGLIDGRRVCVYSQDETIFEGAIGEVNADKVAKLYDLATKTGVPIISIHAARGTRAVEGLQGLASYTTLLKAQAKASGLVPQIAIIAGDNVGLAAISPSFADVTIYVEGATLTVVEPAIIAETTSASSDAEALGGTAVHSSKSGLAHLRAESDTEALAIAREVASYLPLNNHAEAPRSTEVNYEEAASTLAEELDTLLPDSDSAAYDALDVVSRVVDGGSYLELQQELAPNIVTVLARIEGRAVGIVANQPTALAGCLDLGASKKAARFIRMCDAFNIPVVQFVDSPGFIPSESEEHAGVARAAAQLAFAFAEATVGTITVITRKAYGAAYAVMGAKTAGADLVYAWPTAQIAVSDARTASSALYGDKAADNEDAWAAENLTPYRAAENGLVDAVIEPSQTRTHLMDGLRLLDRKMVPKLPKKHGTIAL